MRKPLAIKRSAQRRCGDLTTLDDRLIGHVLALGLITGVAGRYLAGPPFALLFRSTAAGVAGFKFEDVVGLVVGRARPVL